jgi:hypothetical protein
MEKDEFFKKLNVSKEWVDLGIITPEVLEDLKRMYEEEQRELKEELENKGILEQNRWELSFFHDDHYRWRAFKRFLDEKKPVSSEIVTALYKLGEKDPDYTMGRSMMRYVLDEKNCPMELLELALQAEEKFLVNAANQAIERRKKLVRSID